MTLFLSKKKVYDAFFSELCFIFVMIFPGFWGICDNDNVLNGYE